MMSRRFSVAALGAFLVAALFLSLPQPLRAAVDAAAEESVIELVICLDTSNSMDGLIEAAKLKLWDIVNALATAQPTPRLRVALFSYGNDGYSDEGWVRKDLGFTDDLDLIYEKLNGLTTNGGTEYVARVIREATMGLEWSEDKNTLKLIFVAGNEPATQDPKVPIQKICKRAIEQDIMVNPIYCGDPMDSDAESWKKVARLADGEFSAIDQDSGTVVIATPMDHRLSELSVELNTTYVVYGRSGGVAKARQEAQDQAAVALSPSAGASRAVAKSGKLYTNTAWDLVDASDEEDFDLEKVDKAELSEEMQAMSLEERKAHVEKMKHRRKEVQDEISKLNVERQKYIEAEMKKQNLSEDKALDKAIKKVLRKQAAKKGITIE